MHKPGYSANTIVPTESAEDYAAHLTRREEELSERYAEEREVPQERLDAIARYLERRR